MTAWGWVGVYSMLSRLGLDGVTGGLLNKARLCLVRFAIIFDASSKDPKP